VPCWFGEDDIGDTMTDWMIEERAAPAAELLDGGRGEPWPHRWVQVAVVERPALVLGSTQVDRIVDRGAAEAAGVDVVRRRTGGGAVYVAPGAQVWIDCWVPSGDPVLERDIGRSFDWLGTVWRAALAATGVEATLHAGRLEPGRWGRLICFAALGPGEVHVGGAKVVGLSQHRTRAGSRFHTAALLGWEPERLLALLDLSPETRAAVHRHLSVAAMPLAVDGGDLVRAFLGALPP
jgi:lipoate-protein ligase A